MKNKKYFEHHEIRYQNTKYFKTINKFRDKLRNTLLHFLQILVVKFIIVVESGGFV